MEPQLLPQQEAHALTHEVSFKEILLGVIYWMKYVLTNWILIFIIMIIGGTVSLIKANREKLHYIASSTFVLQEGGNATGPSNSFASILGLSGPEGGGIFQGDNLFELYRSRFMIKKTLLSKTPDSTDHLIDRYIEINGLRQAWKYDPLLKNIDFFKKGNKRYARAQDSLLTLFVNDINNNYLAVFRVGRLSIFRVEVRSVNEEFSKIFNDQIVKTVNAFYIETRTGQSIENLKLLQHQVDSINLALNGAMYKVAASSDITVNVNPARQVLRLPSQRSQVEAENNRAMLNELVRNLEVSKMALRKESPLIKIIDDPVYPLVKYRESRAKATVFGAIVGGTIAIAFFSISLLYKRVLQ